MPVIGTRSWGGLVGVSQFIQLVDGGGITAPDYRIYDKDGKMWDRLQLFVNGKMIGRDELSRPMQDGDELQVLLNIGGG